MLKYLTEPQQRELLKAPRTLLDPLARRDYHWMSALILTGMRVHEFSRLTVERVKMGLASGWLVSDKQHCKGKRRANEYCVTAQLRMHLLALIRISDELSAGLQQPADGQPLVWGRAVDGVANPLSVRSYEARFKHWVKVAGLDERLSPHALRHTRGMNVITRCRGNNPLKVAQIALNHASLRSTGVYLHVSREEVAAQLQLVDGGGRMRKADAVRLAAGAGA